MTMDGLDKLTATPGIGMREMRIFAVLLKRLDYENFIMVPQTDIVSATGFAASNVSASVKARYGWRYHSRSEGRSVADLSLVA